MTVRRSSAFSATLSAMVGVTGPVARDALIEPDIVAEILDDEWETDVFRAADGRNARSPR